MRFSLDPGSLDVPNPWEDPGPVEVRAQDMGLEDPGPDTTVEIPKVGPDDPTEKIPATELEAYPAPPEEAYTLTVQLSSWDGVRVVFELSATGSLAAMATVANSAARALDELVSGI